jgi:methionine sulfoxide reductase heme-binding subunit
MSVQYVAVGWNRQKKIYDVTLASAMTGFLALFLGAGWVVHPNATAETLLIRAFGSLAILLLHVILAIGPLCRLQPFFLPLLYNRRHLGVAMFFAALVHGVFSLIQFHALGDVNPLLSLFISNTRFDSIADFPFQILGFFALGILFLMAATSHDFWLHNLTPGVWKRLHMMVYLAYGLVVAHVALGALQSETSPVLAGILMAGVLSVSVLHLLAARREMSRDRELTAEGGFVDVCGYAEVREGRGKTVCASGERIAVFKHEGRIYALSNVCRHQNGPLGEGRIIDGCVTCPWHGYQYMPDTGMSPPPFTDQVPVFETRVTAGNRILVNPVPLQSRDAAR